MTEVRSNTVIYGKTKKMVVGAVLMAIGVILPMFFHMIPNAGSIFLPMHIPVLLAGLVLGWQFGLVVGILTPLISSLSTGMPPVGFLPSMMIELAVYGLIAGLLIAIVKTKSKTANIYISLIGAMIVGRIVAGIVRGFIITGGNYSFKVWITASFITALPGIIIQLVIIPVLVSVLQRTQLYSQN